MVGPGGAVEATEEVGCWISLKAEPMVFVYGWGLGREKEKKFLARAVGRMELP